MNDLEKLEQKAYEENIKVDYVSFKSKNIHGLYCDGSIAINSDLQTTASKADVLAEEMGHYYTTSGIITNTKIISYFFHLICFWCAFSSFPFTK